VAAQLSEHTTSSGTWDNGISHRKTAVVGVSRSTWYRRRKKARDAATACAIFARAEAFAAALARDLARCAALERETMAIIAELAALPADGHPPEAAHG
jgi:hypothetical protein